MKSISSISLIGLLSCVSARIHIQPIFQEIPVVFETSNGGGIRGFDYPEQLSQNPTAIAIDYVRQVNSEYQFAITSAYTTDHNQVANAFFNVNVQNGKVISSGNSFYGHVQAVSSEPSYLTAVDAVRSFAEIIGTASSLTGREEAYEEDNMTLLSTGATIKVRNVPFALSDVTSKLVYLQTNNGRNLVLAWEIQVEMEENFFIAHVSAKDGIVLQILDWVSDASYNVFPVGVNDPKDGSRQLRVGDDNDATASPLGWHSTGNTNYTTTRGNNVAAQQNWSGGQGWENNYRPDGGSNLSFDFQLNLAQDPKNYINAATTNLFYWNNLIHDIFVHYGFDEKSGNFQENNFGRGGKENDSVIAQAQDGSGMNNANFMTPPDGFRGRMRMYVWNRSTPKRDGDLDNGIIIHEYAHGISNRLTGGPSNVSCLGYGEAGGMGEGWGDFFGTILRMRPTYTRFTQLAMGDYSMNNTTGVRRYVYTSDKTVNPSTYSYIKKPQYSGVHAKGEVWAVILWEVYWNLVDEYGFDPDWKNGTKGNNVALQLVVDGMKLQPCRPTFVDARDAILQADTADYNGVHTCLLWKGFASRGLGLGASSGGNESFDLPDACKNVEPIVYNFRYQ